MEHGILHFQLVRLALHEPVATRCRESIPEQWTCSGLVQMARLEQPGKILRLETEPGILHFQLAQLALHELTHRLLL